LRILQVTRDDLYSVLELIERVSVSDVSPHLAQGGKDYFYSEILPQVETTFGDLFTNFKVEECGLLVGFGAIRSDDYITHLFINKAHQRKGFGKLLLEHLLKASKSNEIGLKASVNSVDFYKSQGFKSIGKEASINGLRFVSMGYETHT